MTIQILRLGCLLRGHEWATVEWNPRGVPVRFCCLRCFKERQSGQIPRVPMPSPRPPQRHAR